MTIGREVSSSAPVLVVRTQGPDRSLKAGRSYSIGRNPESDIVVNEARVSWRHAVLRLEGATWLLEDTGSTNGTFVMSSECSGWRSPPTVWCGWATPAMGSG